MMSRAHSTPPEIPLKWWIFTISLSLVLLTGGAMSGAEQTGETNADPNRAPLKQTPFTPLPLGAVRAQGWLEGQLQRQADGLTGHAEELMPDLGPNSGWLGGTGDSWERGPYYVKGLVSLAYITRDPVLIAKSKKWVNWTLENQRPDGQIGPVANEDWWPRMLITWALRDYYEATGDPRVIAVLAKYAHFIQNNLPSRPLKEWAKARAIDQIDTLYWLYNRTGDASLLETADLLRGQSNHWDAFFSTLRETRGDFFSAHNVNVTEAMKFSPVIYQRTGEPNERERFLMAWELLQRQHGLPTGMWGGTEFLTSKATHQGIEMCAIVEQMLSSEIAIGAVGDPSIGDNLERIAFNLLPGGTTKNFHQFQYYTIVNQPVAHPGPAHENAYGYHDDHGDDLVPGPMCGFPCCCFNMHMGWPKYVQHTWMASNDGGLAVVAYGPTEVTTTVNNTRTAITEETDYPFADTITLEVKPEHRVDFPLRLRIPGWSIAPHVTVNGTAVSDVQPGSFLKISRTWKTGDVVVAEFPARLTTANGINGSAALWRGPLAFSLRIGEKATPAKPGVQGFEELAMDPITPWNYALDINRENPEAGAHIVRGSMTANPWLPDTTPIKMTIQAKRLKGWGLTHYDRLAAEVPVSPASSDEPIEQVTLVPFGAQTLRITAFPLLRGPPILEPGIIASFHNEGDSTDDMLMNPDPTSSADHSVRRFTWWDHKGAAEWLQWTFPQPTEVSTIWVYWFDDNAGCAVPASWELSYLDGGAWKRVENASGFGVVKDRANQVTFTSVKTAALRIDVQLADGKSGGILQLKK